MPIVTVSLIGGRAQREKDRLAEAITESVCKILRVDKKEVVVVFQEGPHGNYYSEGIRLWIMTLKDKLVFLDGYVLHVLEIAPYAAIEIRICKHLTIIQQFL